MTVSRLSLRALAITFAMVAVAGVVVALGRPTPIESAVLGAEWQCTRTAFVLTTCSPRMQEATPAVETARKLAIRPTRG